MTTALSNKLKVIISFIYHSFKLEVPYTPKEVVTKLDEIIDTEGVYWQDTKKVYEGYLGEDGFRIKCKATENTFSAVVIRGRFEKTHTGTNVEINIRFAYIMYVVFVIFVPGLLAESIVDFVGGRNWIAALLGALFAGVALTCIFWYEVRRFKRAVSKIFLTKWKQENVSST
ncbi:MAG: hypothetical protein JSW23_05295 [Planctomycetota bacterium]|nr:MAG: hypothetical protein JSW23_05295 [Planctomycetota bacterium]